MGVGRTRSATGSRVGTTGARALARRPYILDLRLVSDHGSARKADSEFAFKRAAVAFSRDQGRPELETRSGDSALQAVYERLAYTVEEAASILDVGRDLLYDEIRTGRLRSRKAGARRVIARHQLLEWLDSD